MDKSKPPIPSDEFRLRSVSELTSAAIDAAPPRLTNPGERAAVEPQSRSGQVEPCRNAPSDKRSIAVYYRDEGEVSEGFFIALRAMGLQSPSHCPGRPSIPSGEQSREDATFTTSHDHHSSCAFTHGSE
jgi:hypothetical protein